MLGRRLDMDIDDLGTLVIANVLFIWHFIAHYVIARNFYIVSQRLQESGHLDVLNRFISAAGAEPVLRLLPHYPEFRAYLIIVLIASGSLTGLTLLMYKLIMFIVSRKNREKTLNDVAWFLTLVSSYLLIYFITVYIVAKIMLYHWADYGTLLVSILLVSINQVTGSFISSIRNKLSQDPQRTERFQQFVGRVVNFFFQGFTTLFIAIFVYILFLGYSSFPEEAKEYTEYLWCITMGVLSGGIYVAIVLINIYRLLKLEYNIILHKA